MARKDEMGVGAIAGFQVPIGIKKRKKKVDELLELNGHVTISEALAFVGSLSGHRVSLVEGMLDEGEYASLAKMMKESFAENALRQVVRKRIRELVRKQSDGKFVLYAPNPGKKKGAKSVGEFPTRAAARRAELQRFPPKDPDVLKQRRKEVDKIRKDPSLAAKDPERKKGKKKESIDRMVSTIVEGLFREERQGSDWDEFISRLSKQAVLADKKFQGLQKEIAKKSQASLKKAVKGLKSALKGQGFDVRDRGVRERPDEATVYVEIAIGDTEGTVEIDPIYVFIEHGRPKIEMSSNAKVAITKMDPERVKALRAELVSVQEDQLEADESVAKAIAKRDAYLEKAETDLDKFVSGLGPLEITMLKNLLTKKYRKL